MHRRDLLLAPALLAPGFAQRARAAAAAPRVVVELFTSQSCSSCPAADAVLSRLAAERPDVLALSMHVTYWNRLGWRDPFSLPEATERQRRYAATIGHGQIYTPQLVVQGRRDVVGSQREAVLAAIAEAPVLRVPVAAHLVGEEVAVELGAGAGAAMLWLVGFDERRSTAVTGGENGGRQLSHAHVVRSLLPLGRTSSGAAQRMVARPAGERVAVLLQAENGAVLGAAVAT